MVDYAYYTGVYGGTDIPEGEWLPLARRAADYLAAVTFGRDLEGYNEAKLAACAVAEVLRAQKGREGVQSERAGEYQASYRDDGGDRLYRAAKLYLGGTGLMYRGVI